MIFLNIGRTSDIVKDKIKRLKGDHVSKLGRDPGKIQTCQVTNFGQACTGSHIFCALKEPATVRAVNVG